MTEMERRKNKLRRWLGLSGRPLRTRFTWTDQWLMLSLQVQRNIGLMSLQDFKTWIGLQERMSLLNETCERSRNYLMSLQASSSMCGEALRNALIIYGRLDPPPTLRYKVFTSYTNPPVKMLGDGQNKTENAERNSSVGRNLTGRSMMLRI